MFILFQSHIHSLFEDKILYSIFDKKVDFFYSIPLFVI